MNGIRITAVLTVAVMLFAALAVAIPADVDAAGTGSHLKGFEYSLDKSDVQNYLVDNGILDKDQKLDDMLGLLADVYVTQYLGSEYDATVKTDFKIYAGVLTDSRGDKVSDKVAYSIYCDVEASVTGQFSEDANDLPSMVDGPFPVPVGSARANSLPSMVDGSSSTADIKTKERTLTFGISMVSEGYIGDTTYFNGNELVGT
ncbi:MAG: hypothetical protein IJ856_01060, partial [Candidatus Methanomethylophilaceae archaeon]|nr:hypothetical protein [Candidatus Methanomethylophilaceae archaeon]